jgi:cytidylate kinase
MSGGEELAKCLATSLGYPILGRVVAVEAATALGVSEETLARKFEAPPTLWSRITSDRRIYVTAVQAALAEHASGGNLVYHGYAGHLLLKDIPKVLRVRLIAPLEQRMKTVMETHSVAEDEARDYLHRVDEARIRWTKFLYDRDWSDASLYDLVINLEALSIEAACSAIAGLAARAEFTLTDEDREGLVDFRTSCRIRVALAANPQTRGLELAVSARSGVVEITGQIPAAEMLTHSSRRSEEEIMRTAQEVEGVTRVLLRVERVGRYR